MREIVTLQLGNYSNYVATHFWNAQESYFTYSEDDQAPSPVDHDVHWRAGIGADGSDTFLPRTLIYDLKGGFGPLRKINPLYDAAAARPDADMDMMERALWPGTPAIHRQTPLELGSYQASLDAGTNPSALTPSSIRYWSDYSRVYYHPRSPIQLYDYELHSAIMPFERFAMGAELFRSLERDDDLLDRDTRPFVEECDQIQGFQVFATLDDAWAGFAGSYIEALRDEHPKACIWLWGLQAPGLGISREKRMLRGANVAQALNQACSQASVVVPLTVPGRGLQAAGVVLDAGSAWHTSALLATAAESLLLPTRLRVDPGRRSQPASLSELAESLNLAGNQTLANMRMAVGSNANANANAASEDHDALDIGLSDVGYLKAETACRNDSAAFFGRVSTVRGNRNREEDDGAQEDKAGEDSSRRPVIGRSVLKSYTSPLEFPLLDSFPSIYTSAAGQPGIPVHAAVSTDKAISARMRAFRAQVSWAVEPDQREALVNGLAEIGDAYQDDWYSGSDLDDDDL